MDKLNILLSDSGLANLTIGQFSMIVVGLLLIFLAIRKGFEPLLLLPIGFGAILVNIPEAGMYAAPVYDAEGHLMSAGGLLYYIYHVGIESAASRQELQATSGRGRCLHGGEQRADCGSTGAQWRRQNHLFLYDCRSGAGR